jgi:hypothetical protein
MYDAIDAAAKCAAHTLVIRKGSVASKRATKIFNE